MYYWYDYAKETISNFTHIQKLQHTHHSCSEQKFSSSTSAAVHHTNHQNRVSNEQNGNGNNNQNISYPTFPEEQQFLGVSHFLTPPPQSSDDDDPISVETINSFDFLSKRIQACSRHYHKNVNMLYVDHWNVGNVVEFVQRQNKALTVTTRANV